MFAALASFSWCAVDFMDHSLHMVGKAVCHRDHQFSVRMAQVHANLGMGF